VVFQRINQWCFGLNNILAAIILGATLVAGTTAQGAFTYMANTDSVSVTITGYTDSVPDDLVIPPKINGLTVTAIGEGAFGEVNNLTNVTIPNTVTTIGEAAFNAAGLTSVTIPYGVTNISDAAFEDCENMTNAIIPASVTTIGPGAFSDTALTDVTIPNSVANLGDGALSSCHDLTNVSLGSGVTSIAHATFVGDFMLQTIKIPAAVTNLGDIAFEDCSILTDVFFLGNAPNVESTTFPNTAFYGFHDMQISNYYTATAYYLPGTTGWDQFMTNTLMSATGDSPTNEFVPAVLWNPTIQTTGTNFGVQNGQYGFNVTATTNLPIAIEACDDLTQSNWVVLQRLTLTNGLYHFSETFHTNAPTRFYRIGFP
jgi:hypothetical protein